MPNQDHHLLHAAYGLLGEKKINQAKSAFENLLSAPAETKAFALNGLGLCETLEENISAAESYFLEALDLLPQETEILNNLAICMNQQARYSEALNYFDRLRQVAPSFEFHYNFAYAALYCGFNERAFYALAEALRLAPRHNGSLTLFYKISQTLFADSAFCQGLEQRLRESPEQPLLNLSQAFLYVSNSDYKIALKYVKTAFLLEPRLYESLSHMVSDLQSLGQHEVSLVFAKLIYFYEPSSRSLADAIPACQKLIYQNREEIEGKRLELKNLLQAFMAHTEPLPHRPLMRPQAMNFYHAYQGYDDRELQEQIAQAFLAVIPKRKFKYLPQARPRVGFMSLHLRNHSVMHLLQAAVEHVFAAADLEIYLLLEPAHLCTPDEVTEKLKTSADHVIQLSAEHLEDLETIEALNLDVLVYLDIGMDSLTYFLAFYRLARFQMALPGHPITTGLPSMDYFISSDVLERSDAQQYYSEQLIRLKGLPDYAPLEKPPQASRESLNLPEGNLYFCPMTIFKMHPDMDAALRGILEQDPEAQILFLSYRNKTHLLFKARIEEFLGEVLAARIHFLPWSPQTEFFQRLMACDVILDTFYFGGGNTSYQAFGLGCAIVALDVPWNKGRWTQAMYKLMDIEGLVAKDPEQYVQLAVELATNKTKQKQIRSEILARSSVLFQNPTWSEGFLSFIRELVQPPE